MKNVTVIIPVIRDEQAKVAEAAVYQNCPGANIIIATDHDGIGCPAMVEKLANRATTDLILFLGDDTEIMPGALDVALQKMNEFPGGWGLIGLNTEGGKKYAHWLAHRKILDFLPNRQFFNTDYHHFYCDDELHDIAQELDRWAWAEDAHVKHHHHSTGLAPLDKYNRRVNSRLKDDWVTYNKRKRARKQGGIAIGFPLVDDRVPVQFFTSFACMEKPSEYRFIVPYFPHGPWAGSLADARNSLVQQALDDGCSHLLMLDTDQVYPPETLMRLLSHDVDICGVRVHRRWMPFDPIFLRGDVGRYESVPDDEMYSGDLIPVDATGTGCLLFNMDVFLRIDQPWFEFGMHEGKPVGEDVNLCSKARAAGIEIYVDTSIEVGHLATVQINRGFHQICKHMTASVP